MKLFKQTTPDKVKIGDRVLYPYDINKGVRSHQPIVNEIIKTLSGDFYFKQDISIGIIIRPNRLVWVFNNK